MTSASVSATCQCKYVQLLQLYPVQWGEIQYDPMIQDLLKLHAVNGNSLQLNLMRQVALSDFLIFPEQHVKVTDFDVTDFHQSIT